MKKYSYLIPLLVAGSFMNAHADGDDCPVSRDCTAPQVNDCPAVWVSILGGYASGSAKVKLNQGGNNFGRPDLAVDGLQYGASVGVGKAFFAPYHLYAGLEAGAVFGVADNKSWYSNKNRTDWSIRRTNSIEGAVLFGQYLFNSLLYLKAGVTGGKWIARIKGANIADESTKFVNRRSTGLMAGAGIRSNITSNIAAGLEYQWHRYPTEGKENCVPAKLSSRMHNFRVALTWNF